MLEFKKDRFATLTISVYSVYLYGLTEKGGKTGERLAVFKKRYKSEHFFKC